HDGAIPGWALVLLRRRLPAGDPRVRRVSGLLPRPRGAPQPGSEPSPARLASVSGLEEREPSPPLSAVPGARAPDPGQPDLPGGAQAARRGWGCRARPRVSPPR